jgi:hypothetical protein
MSDAEISGAYVAAFVQSAGEVSPVFEKKAKETLADRDITEPDPESWYDNEKFGDALFEIVDKAGEKTVAQAGKEMVAITEEILEQDDIDAGLEVLTSQHAEIHKNHTVTNAGVLTYEQRSPTSYRVASEGGYEYPASLVKGAAEETVRQTGGPASVDVADVEAEANEPFAFKLSW